MIAIQNFLSEIVDKEENYRKKRGNYGKKKMKSRRFFTLLLLIGRPALIDYRHVDMLMTKFSGYENETHDLLDILK